MHLGRLLFFFDWPFWRQGETVSTDRSMWLLAEALGSGFDSVKFLGRLYPETQQAFYRCVPQPGYQFVPIPYYPDLYSVGALLRALPTVARRIWSAVGEADVVLVGIPHPWAVLLWIAARLRGREVVFVVRQELAGRVRHRAKGAGRGLARAVVYLLEAVTIWMSRSTLTFAVGHAELERYGGPRPNLHLHMDSVIPQRRLRSEPRTGPKPGKRRRLISVGRLDPDKGYDQLIEALVRMDAEANDLELDLVGDGPSRESLEHQAREVGLADRVHFAGHIPYQELDARYDAADLFVLPSHSEGFPKVILEAMAAGLPVVSTAVGGIPHLLQDGDEALLVEPGDVPGLMQALEQVLGDEALYRKLSTAGLHFVKDYTLEASRDSILSRIHARLEARSKPGSA